MGGGPDEALQGEAVARCASDIESADFVALDLEFSGLFLKTERDKRILSLEDLYDKCAESIPEFLPLQLGICCARKQQEGGLWELRSHEFNLWPQERRIFTADLQSLRFLRSHGFDFNAFFHQAFKYNRLPPADMDQGAMMRRLPPTHATRIMAALRKSRAPLVFHNAMLDLMHLHDKFVGDLPDEYKEFGESWTTHFPLLFDTRLIAHEGKYSVLRHAGGLSLEELHKHLSGLPDLPVKFERGGPLGTGSAAHGSSGHDAILTAEVFVMAMDMWLRADASGSNKRRKKAAPSAGTEPAAEAAGTAAGDAATAGDNDGWTVVGRKRPLEASGAAVDAATAGLASPSLLESHEVCRRFHNRIAVMGAAPGVLDLGRPPGLQMPSGLLPPPEGTGPALPGDVPAVSESA